MKYGVMKYTFNIIIAQLCIFVMCNGTARFDSGAANDTFINNLVIPRGLPNTFNNCFLNSLLQGLFHSNKIRNYFLNTSESDEISTTIRNIFKYLMYMDGDNINIEDNLKVLSQSLDMRLYAFADLSEALMKIYDVIKEEDLFINDKISGEEINSIRCTKCEDSRIINQAPINTICCSLGDENNRINDLDSAIKNTFEIDISGIQDGCKKCGSKRYLRHHHHIIRPPGVLPIITKRAKTGTSIDSSERFVEIKDNSKMKFNELMDLKKYTIWNDLYTAPLEYLDDEFLENISPLFQANNMLYNISCIMVHSGSATHGHYYCYVKFKNRYYKINDANVGAANNNLVFSESFGTFSGDEIGISAYCLMYSKEINNELV